MNRHHPHRATRVLVSALGAAFAAVSSPPARAQVLPPFPPPGGMLTTGPVVTVPAPTTPPPTQIAPYRRLTDNLNEVANFNVEPHRGMVIYGFNEEVWALNVHGSTLHKYVGAVPQPAASYATLLNPVSIALWEDQLLVLGGGTHALALHDRLTGDVLGVLDLPSEPFALEVDEGRDRAWITCQGADRLVEVDLLGWTIAREFEVPGARPGWISLHNFENDFDGDDEVWVTPEVSGNNTISFGPVQGAVLISGENTSLFPNGGLPDADVIAFDVTTGQSTVIGKDVNTIQFGHATHPSTGETWCLGAESFNLAFSSEDDHNGKFQSNRISITDYGAATTFPKTPDRFTVLDVVDSLVGGNPKTVSHPRSIVFEPISGAALVASQTGDMIAVLDQTGLRLPALDITLDPGSIPAQVMLDATGTLLLVYNWGDNTIDVISLQGGTFLQTLLTFDLGHDPASPAVRKGREIFYDADNSLNDQVTCGSCHPGGASDSLAWNIQDDPTDPKGVMVTQTLYGIEDNFPHHWRGERNLHEFNVAFEGLLGGQQLDETPGGELDQFAAFVNSLTSFANPNAHPSRQLFDTQTSAPLEDGSIGSAVAGQDMFFDVTSDGAATCFTCHSGATGSSGDPVSETGSFNPHMNRTEIMQLDNQVELKDQRVVLVDVTNPAPGMPPLQFPVQELGSGWAHNGVIRSLLGFLQIFGQLSPQQQSDGVTYIKQFDTGISPAAHESYRLAQTSDPATGADIRAILVEQAEKGWIGVVAFGRSSHGGAPHHVSWAYDRTLGAFVPDDSTLLPRRLGFFLGQARVGDADMVFMGVPPGNETRLGIDWDNDGVRNQDETAQGLLPRNPDSDADGWEDGHELANGGDPLDPMVGSSDSTAATLVRASEDLTVANLSKWHVELSEKARIEMTFGTPGGKTWKYRGEDFARKHTVVLQHREASTLNGSGAGKLNSFAISARLVDVAGNVTLLPNFGVFDAETMLNLGVPAQTVMGDLQWTSLNSTAGTLSASISARIDFKEFGPPAIPAANHVLIGQVLVRDTTTGKWSPSPNVTTTLPTSFQWTPNPPPMQPPTPVDYTTLPGALAGPFLVLPPTDPSGVTGGAFSVSGLTAGQGVRFVVRIHSVAPSGYDPLNPVFTEPGPPVFYDLPTTPKELRLIETSF